ncbi:hypothetical protein [Mesorhizobium argentiipisi]|uniref:Diacylglycerol kinase n=1 Tax=Mesorhizobium argentiipisi TaxID=3015175 RepID=A0ABU8KLQ0_9HYPH
MTFYEEWRDRAKTFHESIFRAIEGILLLATLQYGYQKTGSLYIGALMAVGYAAMLTMLIEDMRYGMHAFFDRFFEGSRYRGAFLWGAGAIVIALFFILPTQVTHVIDQLVTNHLMSE